MEFKHFSHNHGLVAHHIPPSSDQVQCNGCKSPASGSLYVCWKCHYFLHDQCFRAPRSFNHPSHPMHPLTLVPFPTYPSASFFCNSCNAPGHGFSYTCTECEFDVHVHCAHLPHHPTNPNFNSPIYPPPVETNPYPNPYPPQTAVYPPVSNPTVQNQPPNYNNIPQTHYPTNPTPQTLIPPAPVNPAITANMPPPPLPNPILPNYSTVVTNPNPTPQSLIPPAPANPAITTNMPPPPPPNPALPNYSTVVTIPNPTPQTLIPPTPVNPTITTNQPPSNPIPSIYSTAFTTPNPPVSQPDPPQPSQPNLPSTIRHFSHPHILKDMEIDKSNAKICSACECELSGAAYCCTEPHCTFNLHKSCFDSPQEVKHKSHLQHPLKLLTAPPYSDGFTCNACLKEGKAFAYNCATCSFDLHIDCIQWPDTVVRPDHKHALTLYYSSPAAEPGSGQEVTCLCDVCKNPVHELAWMYYCRECDFGTHLECVASVIKTDGGGGGGMTQEELIREMELKFAVLQLLMGQQSQGLQAALDLL